MKFEHILLGLLAMNPVSGYDLMKWFDTEGQFLRSNTHHSQIYRELGRMVRDGLVEFEVETRASGPDAKVYRITEIGRDVLLDWARSPYVPTSRFQDADFNTRLIFTTALDAEAALRVVDTELTYRRDQVAKSRGRSRAIVGIAPIPEFDARRYRDIGDLMHQYGATAVDRWMEWLEEVRAALVAEIEGAHTDTEETTA